MNGAPVNEDLITAPMDCPEVDATKFVDEKGSYISYLEELVTKFKKDPVARLQLSFSHAAPCADLTFEILQAKLRLYESRLQDVVNAIPQTHLEEVRKTLQDRSLDAAKNILTGKKPFTSTYEYNPDIVKNLTEFKCKTHFPPTFDSWYAGLNKLHSVYAKDLASLYEPVAKLTRVVHDLYASDTQKNPFRAFNQLDYAISAYDLIADSCSLSYDPTEFKIAEKQRDFDAATTYLQALFDILNGVPRSIPPPEIKLSVPIQTSPALLLDDQSHAIIQLLTEPNDESMTRLNLHVPVILSSKHVWNYFLTLTPDKAKQFLALVGNLSSNSYAAHKLYETVDSTIRKHEYREAITALRTILAFNVYSIDWVKFTRLPFEAQRDQLEFLMGDMTPTFKQEFKNTIADIVSKDPALSTISTDGPVDRKNAFLIAKAYKQSLEKRLAQIHRYLYVLYMAFGERSNAEYYLKRETNYSAYLAAVDAARANRNVFKIRTTFQATQLTVDKLIEKIIAFTPKSKDAINARIAFLLQYSKADWLDPTTEIDYYKVSELMSPDHAVNRIVEHVSKTLFPEEANLNEARKFVERLIFTYRNDSSRPIAKDIAQYGNALIQRAIAEADFKETDLSAHINREIAAFKPSPKRMQATQFLQKSIRARENLWPGENKSFFSKFTENLPYLDGEYTLNIVVRVRLLSETNELVILKRKEQKTCDEKELELKLLSKFLFKTPSSKPSEPKSNRVALPTTPSLTNRQRP